MMRHLSNELSRRARHLLSAPRKNVSEARFATLLNELVFPEITLEASVQGTLMVEETISGKTIYMESPNGTIIRTSPDEELAAAIEILKKHMVLDDLANV